MDDKPPARLKPDTSRGFAPGYEPTATQAAAAHAIARLDGELSRFEIHPDWLAEARRAAYVTNAHASASIEGNPLSREEAAAVVASAPRRPAPPEREILLHVRYLAGLRSLPAEDPPALDVEEIERAHRDLLDGVLPAEKRVGEVRGPRNVAEAYFGNNLGTPPGRVPAELEALLRWLHGTGCVLAPPVRAALWLHEFLSIHPFRDGNGRVARALTHRLLRTSGLPNVLLVTLDRAFNEDRDAYLRALDAAREEGRVGPWVDHFLACLRREYESARDLLGRVARVPAGLTGAPRAVLEHVLRSGAPVIRVSDLRRALPDYAPITLSLALAALANRHGLLRHNGKRGRASAYETSEGLAARLGSR